MSYKEQFLTVFEKWYSFVNQDHHKDSDCHFRILTVVDDYSYGERSEIYYGYYAYHNGYLLGDISDFFKTEEECYEHFVKNMEHYMSLPSY